MVKSEHQDWERNTSGIKAAAQKKREAAFAKAEEAIRKLIKEKKPINFESVAEVAGVTRAWLYKQPELRSRIEMLREQQGTKQQLPPQLKASDASKATLLTEIRNQNKALRAENQKLKRELEEAYGQALGYEELQVRNRDLEKQNQHLFNLLTQARVEIEGLKNQAFVGSEGVTY